MRLTPVALLTAAVAVVGANSMVLAPIASSVALDLGGGSAGVVQATAAFGGATALSALTLAPRADRVGADRALREAVIVLTLALLGSMLAPNRWALVGAQAVAGLGAGVALPAIYALAPQMGPKGREKRTIGIVLSGWTLALVGGVAGSGLIAEFFGWRTVYAILFTLMVGLLAVLLRTDMTVPRHAATSPLTGLRVPGAKRGLASAFLLMLGFYGTYAYLGAHVVDRLGYGTDGTALVTLAYGIGFGMSVLLDPLAERTDPRLGGGIAFAGLAATYLGMAVTGAGYAALLTLAFFWGITQHAALGFVVARLAGLTDTQRGAVMGLNSAATYLAVTAGALAFRLPYEAGGLIACAVVSAICTAVAAGEAAARRQA